MNEKFHKILAILFAILIAFGIIYNLVMGIINHDVYYISIAIFVAVITDAHFYIK